MPNPEQLQLDHTPAIIKFIDGEEHLVPHQFLNDQGWLFVIGWAGTRRRYPPQRIAHVEIVETERRKDDDGRAWKVLDDDELMHEAKLAAGAESEPAIFADGSGQA